MPVRVSKKRLRVFVCHAHDDASLAAALRALVLEAIPMTAENIRCTSHPASNVAPGREIDATLRREVAASDVLIALMTRRFFESPYALMELGARWGTTGHLIPVLFPGATRRHRLLPISRNVWLRPSRGHIFRLLGSVAKATGQRLREPGAYDRAIREFLELVESQPQSHSHATLGQSTPKVLAKHHGRLPGEVYAIELLKKEVTVLKKGGRTSVQIDRAGVRDVILSNEGKLRVYAEHVQGRERAIWEQDDYVHRRLLSRGRGPSVIQVNPASLQLPLRWASGGVLSIVRFKKRPWVPLLFRDIRPFGWNLPLGSAERWFDDRDHVRDPRNSLETELNYPWNYIKREFIEEILIVNRDPRTGGPLRHRGFAFPHPAEPMDALADRHRTFRAKFDGLDILPSRDRDRVPVRFQETTTTVIVRDRKGVEHETHDVLVAFALTDLGVEVVKVVEYSLAATDYLLDGEIRRGHDRTDDSLVRMPIALVSCDYLKQIFNSSRSRQRTDGPAPSFDIGAPPEREVRLFSWDIERRLRIIRGQDQASRTEFERQLDWYDRFGAYFLDENGRVTSSHLPSLFVPATARLLELYFSGQGARTE